MVSDGRSIALRRWSRNLSFYFQQAQTVQKAIGDSEEFSIARIFAGHGLHALSERPLRRGIRGGINFTFHAPQFFQIAAASLMRRGEASSISAGLFLKSNRVASSLRAWVRALTSSPWSTSETMSKEGTG